MGHLRNILLIIRTIFIYFLAGLSLAIVIITGSIVAIFSKSKTQPLQTGGRIWGKFVMWVCGNEVLISGQENIPRNKGVFFVSNHQSFADAVLIAAYIPINFVITVAASYYWLPIFGWGWKKAGYIPIFRDSPMSFIATEKKIVNYLNAGQSVLIFPEAHRSPDGKVHEFKHVSLLPALQSGAPIVPIAICGSGKVIPVNSLIFYRNPVKFKFGKPIYVKSKEEYEEKLNEVRSAIISMVEES